MALDSTVRKGVALAHKLTRSLQEDVTHTAWIGQDGFGAPEWAPDRQRKALVERHLRRKIFVDGVPVEVQTKLTFLEPVEPNGAPDRIEPLDPKDKIVLFDGETGPIYLEDGMHDPKTGQPYLLEVYLGVSR